MGGVEDGDFGVFLRFDLEDGGGKGEDLDGDGIENIAQIDDASGNICEMGVGGYVLEDRRGCTAGVLREAVNVGEGEGDEEGEEEGRDLVARHGGGEDSDGDEDSAEHNQRDITADDGSQVERSEG